MLSVQYGSSLGQTRVGRSYVRVEIDGFASSRFVSSDEFELFKYELTSGGYARFFLRWTPQNSTISNKLHSEDDSVKVAIRFSI